MITGLLIATVLLAAEPAAKAAARPDAPPGGHFKPLPYTYVEKGQEKQGKFYLFEPRSIDPTKRYPMLVWAGWGDLLGPLMFNDPAYVEKIEFFVVICVHTEEINEIAELVTKGYPIAPDRVYAAGASHGGWVCLDAGMRRPDLFAAIVPMGSGGANVSRASELANTTIWAFHSRDDTFVPSTGDRELVAAVKRAGGNIGLTLIPGDYHDCWTAAFRQYGVMDWMLDQSRAAWVCWTPPGSRAWKWWHLLPLPCGIGATLFWARFREQRRRAV